MSRDESIQAQREMIADMNLVEHKDRLLTDPVMRSPFTGRMMNRGEVFDLMAMYLMVGYPEAGTAFGFNVNRSGVG